MRAYSIPEAKNKAGKITALFLRHFEGTDLSSLFPQLHQLKILDLSDNQLDVLPPGLEGLHRLEHLILNNNQLKTLPSYLPPSLLKLEVRNNDLQSWSEELQQLHSLQLLDLSGNQLSEIPNQVKQLPNLRFLSLSENKISTLPSALGELSNLKTFIISKNQISKLPPIFSTLRRLEKLDLSFNKIQQLPGVIGKCQQLSDLSLNNNQLTKLPNSLFKLRFLRQINLSNNLLPNLTGRIGQLQWLAQLNLSYNHIKRLPSGLGNCTQLQSLYLHSNGLTSLPSALGVLKKLTILTLDHNQLKRLPALPSSLEELSMAGNHFSNFPSSLVPLARLKKLNISDNPLKKIPRTTGKLISLTHLDFKNCPESFQLSSLLYLPSVKTIICDRLNKDQQALLLDILRIADETGLSFDEKKELFSFTDSRKKIRVSRLVAILNQAGPILSYAIRKKLIPEKTAPLGLPEGSIILQIGQSNSAFESPTLRDQQAFIIVSEAPAYDYLLLAEPPYPKLPENYFKERPWLNMRQVFDVVHGKNKSFLTADQRQTIERLLRSSYPAQNKMGIQLLYGVGVDNLLWEVFFDIFQEKPAGTFTAELINWLKAYATEEQRKKLLEALRYHNDKITE